MELPAELGVINKITVLHRWPATPHDDDGWLLDWIELIDERGGRTLFPFFSWIRRPPTPQSNTIAAAEPKVVTRCDLLAFHGPVVRFDVLLKTADAKGASTDATVFITIVGEHGESGERALTVCTNHSVPFERNQDDRFVLPSHDIGKVLSVRMRHDGLLLSQSWLLEHVIVIDQQRNRYFFGHSHWLDAPMTAPLQLTQISDNASVCSLIFYSPSFF